MGKSINSQFLATHQKERSAACTVIGQLDVNNLKSPIVQKIVQIAWNDQNPKVRASAISALGRTGRLVQL